MVSIGQLSKLAVSNDGSPDQYGGVCQSRGSRIIRGSIPRPWPFLADDRGTVRFLEDRLGVRLLNRTTRRQSMTEVGRAFYERCKLVLAEAEAAEALAEDLNATPRGRLRVNAPVIFGTHSLVPMLTRYMRQYPEVTVDLTLTDRLVTLSTRDMRRSSGLQRLRIQL